MTILKKFDKPNKTHQKVIALFMFVFLVSIITEIWTSNRLATYGEEINKLQQATDSLSLDNQLMTDKIAAKSSLSEVAESANSLGFQPIKNIDYLNPPNIALNY